MKRSNKHKKSLMLVQEIYFLKVAKTLSSNLITFDSLSSHGLDKISDYDKDKKSGKVFVKDLTKKSDQLYYKYFYDTLYHFNVL